MQNRIGDARRLYSLTHEKMTQEDAAAFFGVSPSTYRNWEQGIGKLNGEILSLIADKYECSVDYLLMLVESPDPYPKPELVLSDEEADLVKRYRYCRREDKKTIMAVARLGAAYSLSNAVED